MNPASHKARTNRYKQWPGFHVAREQGITGFTRLAPQGHLIAPAAIASVLLMASYHRGMPEHHKIYIDKARALRQHGTWFGHLK